MAPPQGEVFTVHTERCSYIGGSWVQYCSTVVLLSSINIQGFVRFESFWLSIAVLLITYLVIFFYSHQLMITFHIPGWKRKCVNKTQLLLGIAALIQWFLLGQLWRPVRCYWAILWLVELVLGLALPLQFNLLICEFKHDNVLYIPSVSKYFWSPGPTKNELYLNKSYSIVLPFTYASCPR